MDLTPLASPEPRTQVNYEADERDIRRLALCAACFLLGRPARPPQRANGYHDRGVTEERRQVLQTSTESPGQILQQVLLER